MALKLFNTLSRKKETFKPIEKGKVRMYVCGPTVNGVPHLGHAMSQVSFDVLRRYLISCGYEVKFASNITDIDDKIINAANERGVSLAEFTLANTRAHMEDYAVLNVMKPDVQPKATEYVKEMVELVSLLEEKGYTYLIKDDGVYFDISKFEGYGKLSHQKTSDLEAGKRVGVKESKKNHGDFALWKLAKPGEPFWDSPWGKGRPGWHIECSAMTAKILGLPFDIHGGGSDLIFPHHEDELAQSEAGYGKKMVNYWVHNGMVNVEGTKMSKSLGNFKTIRDLLGEYDPMVIRYFVVSNHYRKPLDFSKVALDDASTSYERLKKRALESKDDGKVNKEYLELFKKELDDDFNTPRALAVLWRLVRDDDAKGKYQTIKKMDEVFGLKLLDFEELEIPNKIAAIIEERSNARKAKDWKKSDELRDKLKNLGWIIKDTKDGWEVEKV
jgi:cysteinyl-tRNA synthetase